MSKIKKHSITIETDYDYDMVGICSHHNDYRIVWGLNELLDIQLIKSEENFKISNVKGILSEHPFYEYIDEENYMSIFLLKNKYLGKYLIPEKKQIDYFIFLLNNSCYSIEKFMEQIKQLPTIMAAFSFDPTELSSTENIVFE
jgi:hypothetical protein